MTKEEILDLLRKNPNVQLATVDSDGHPRTRVVNLYSADENGIVFHTGDFKNLYGELKESPMVEMCCYDPQQFLQVRIRARAEEDGNKDFRDRIIDSPGREFLKPTIALKGRDAIRVFRFNEGKAIVWNMMTNHDYPKAVISL